MKKSIFHAGIGLLFMALALSSGAQAKEDLINDILINPARYWNMQVTVVGEVQNVSADPVGTTRGTYTLLDDSCPNTITVRTKDLPPVGRAFRVTGLLLPVTDRANVPVIKESERTDASEFSAATRNLLIGLGAALVILIVIFVFLLLKPKKMAPAPSKSDAGSKPEARPENRKNEGIQPTITVPPPVPQGGETQLLLNPNAELLVEQGNDKGLVFNIKKNVSLIGRPGTRLNDIILTDNTVSKEQAALNFDPITGRYFIVNESAKNPTKVNGIIASQPVFLKGGESIEMGKTALRFKQL
ncbi:MAG: FHA domain-containing protein [Candidatus Aminicenantes bacterium]|nr:FHA domain-containing protein [Candidatus Aminicenantes bacterium]